MEGKNETFTYTYSAVEQEEIKSIRDKYAKPVKEETAMDRLRRLDRSVTKSASIVSMVVGIVSTLILGTGMCCTTVWGDKLFILGIVVGIIGVIGVIMAYPVYTHMVKRKREKLAPEILRLTDELIK